MELYESATLSDWLASKDRVVDTESNMLIFTQLGRINQATPSPCLPLLQILILVHFFKKSRGWITSISMGLFTAI